MAEMVKALQGQAALKPEDVMTPEELKTLKFEKVVFAWAETERHRGGCYTSEYLNSIREKVKEKIAKGEIVL